MYHPRFKGKHYDIGLKFGGILKKQNVDFKQIIHLTEFQEDFGRKSQVILAEVFPEICDEIRGVTEGLNFPYEKFASWLLCMGCCLHDLGCTAFCYENKGDIIYGRNNDLPPELKKVSQSVFYQLERSYSFVGNTSGMINLEEGINEKGLAVAMTFVLPLTVQPGLSSVFLVRYLLEKCETTESASKALESLPIASA
jgi:predicted choloylglycine hydrolase